MKTPVKTVAVALVVVLAFLFAAGAWATHHVDKYLPQLIAHIHQKTGKQVEIRHATVSLFPLSVKLYDVGIRNPKPFPDGYFLKVPTMKAGVELWPLRHRKLVIRSLVLEQPVIDFISDPDGLWNFQNPDDSKQPTKNMRFTMGSIESVQIDKGKLLGSALIDPADTPGPVVLEIDNFSARVKQFDFNAFKTAPDTKVSGRMDAEAARFGDIRVKNLHSILLIASEQLTFKNFQAKTYRGKASGDFTLDLRGKNPSFHSDLDVTGIGVPYLLAEFGSGPPAVTGMMQGKLLVGGEIAHTANPLAEISGQGEFVVHNGQLPGVSQNKGMMEMKRFRNASAAAKPISAFSSFGGDIEMKHHRIYNRKLDLDFYGILVSGGGNLDEISGGLNYSGAATIEKKQGFFLSTFARMFKHAEEKQGKLTFPIRLEGTLSNPQFSVTK
jgi:hypothetical protein